MARLAKQFDERQLRIRGQIFFHGFLVALALLLINAFLQDNAIVWANAFDQNIMIIMVTVMTVSIEAILRGAFFWTAPKPLADDHRLWRLRRPDHCLL